VTNRSKKILLATGGSGGHIFPAVSVADILKKNGYKVCIVSDDIINKYLPTIDHDVEIINTSKNYKSINGIKNILFAILKARKFIKKFSPDLTIGFGSYATFPILLSCLSLKTPFIIHEQNAYMGIVNKFFSKYSKKIMISYNEIYGFDFYNNNIFIFTGSPVRNAVKSLYKSQYALDNNIFNILITGGSLGAKFFSETLPKVFDKKHCDKQNKIRVYHQVQTDYIDKVREYYKEIGLNAVISPFFNNIHELLDKANLVIGRSGNGTLTETSIAGKPAILIPLPTSASNHQEINARNFEKNGAAIVFLENDISNNIKKFRTILFNLIDDKDKLIKMSENMKKNAVVDGDENILKIVNDFF
jgi:UDP-N-acetylglucosamine--N-acetylmuramyl-(pentapeptide) pyrophosphoryl-undecaprenol N-acetylglucosamine transferase